MTNRAAGLLLVLLFSCVCAAGIVAFESTRGQMPSQHAESFHRLTGGIGFGSTLTLSRCAFAFDPRIEKTCRHRFGPIPGGECFCSEHVLTQFNEWPGHSNPTNSAGRSRGIEHVSAH